MSKSIAQVLMIVAAVMGIIGSVLVGLSGYDLMTDDPKPPKVENYQSIQNLPEFNPADGDRNDPLKENGLIALYRVSPTTGKLDFHCTAFVISDTLAVTAAHCLVKEKYYIMTSDDIIIKNAKMQDTKIVAHAGAINVRADMGVVVGDFEDFNKVKIRDDGIPGILGGPFIACGFPWGQPGGVCTPFIPASNFYAQVQGRGAIFPGMSGGPVLDLSCGQIVGINSSMQNGTVIITPTVGIFSALEINIKSP